MIPVRLELKGFLTYRDAAVLDFDGVTTAAIVGDNGHGKSALFDAMTFALFGRHRGDGKSPPEHLLNQDSNELEVRFDFEVDGRLYRIHRTLTRKRRSAVHWACAYEWDGATFVPIPDTDGPRDCSAWTEKHLGMSFETCCASVLLRQDDQTAFIRANPARRHETLCALLNLDPYKRLEQVAQRRLKAVNDALDLHTARLRGLSPHDRGTLVTLARGARDARRGRAAAERCVAATLDRLRTSTLCAEITGQLRTTAAEVARLRGLLADAERIKADADRHAALERLLPLLGAAVDAEEAAERAATKAQRTADLIEALDIESLRDAHKVAQDALSDAVDAAKELEEAEEKLEKEQEQLRPWGEALRAAADALERATQHRNAATSLERDAQTVREGTPEVARLTTLSQDHAWLNQLVVARGERRKAVGEIDKARRAVATLEPQVRAADAAVPKAIEVAKSVEASRSTAGIALARAQAKVEEIERLIIEREQATGDEVCRRCGAPIDADRLAQELRELQEQLGTARDAVRDRGAELGDAEKTETDARSLLEGARDLARDLKDKMKQAVDTARRCAGERDSAEEAVARALGQLSDAVREKARASEASPSAAELTEMRRALTGLPGLRARVDAARAGAQQHDDHVRSAAQCAEDADRLEAKVPTAERDTVRARWAALPGHVTLAHRRYQEARGAIERLRGVEQRAAKAKGDAIQKESEWRGIVETSLAAALEHRATRDGLVARFPVDWRSTPVMRSSVDELAAERDGLAQAAREAEQLATATRELARLQQVVSELERKLAGVPEADRPSIADAQSDVTTARQRLDAARTAAERATVAWRRGWDTVREARGIEEAMRANEASAADWRLLVGLLGREQLQAKLVEDARVGITDAANRELESISANTLQLELRPSRKESSDALELLVTDTTSVREPIEAQFLSGSQRFRVAVAVALGIGRHVGGASRGQRAVMIDEGFGSLDVDGVDAMASHLQDLGGRLERVLVVTHHREMQQRFATCFRVEKDDRSSRVRRIERLATRGSGK